MINDSSADEVPPPLKRWGRESSSLSCNLSTFISVLVRLTMWVLTNPTTRLFLAFKIKKQNCNSQDSLGALTSYQGVVLELKSW